MNQSHTCEPCTRLGIYPMFEPSERGKPAKAFWYCAECVAKYDLVVDGLEPRLRINRSALERKSLIQRNMAGGSWDKDNR